MILFVVPKILSSGEDEILIHLQDLTEKKTGKKVCIFFIDLNNKEDTTLLDSLGYSKVFLFDKKYVTRLKKLTTDVTFFKPENFKVVGKTNTCNIYLIPSINYFAQHIKTARLLSILKPKKEITVVDSYKQLYLTQPICIDIETTGLDFNKDKIVAFGYGTKDGVNSLVWDASCKTLAKDILENSTNIVGHNLVFDLSFLIADGMPLPRRVTDTLVLSKLYNTALPSYNLENLCYNLLDLEYHTQDIDKSKCAEDTAATLIFNKKDVAKTMELAHFLGEKVIKKNLEILPILRTYMNAVRMFSLVKTKPVHLNREIMDAEKQFIEYYLEELETNIKKETGIENLRSTQQKAKYLFEECQLPCTRLTPKGEGSTDRTALQKLCLTHPDNKILPQLLDYGKKVSLLDKFYSKYGDAVYSDYTVHGTETGRTACTSLNKENLQQLPPDMLWRWLLNAKSKFDYSQLELRVGAYVAEEPVLKKIFQDNGDVHAYTQAKIQRVLNSAKITPDIHRRIAKTLNFGVFYGGTGYTLMSRLLKEGIQLPLYVCDGLAQTIGKAFSRIEDYRQDVWLEIINKGYVGVATGRHINYYMAGAVKSKQEAILREGANAKIQGLASDICLSAVVDLWERYGLLPTIYRHDEAVYDVTYEELSAYQKELENPPVLTQYGLEIPLRVDLTNLTVAGARKK